MRQKEEVMMRHEALVLVEEAQGLVSDSWWKQRYEKEHLS